MNAAPASTDPLIWRFHRQRPPQPANITLFMMRPGAKVNRPVTTSARVKIQIIAERCAAILCRRACKTARETVMIGGACRAAERASPPRLAYRLSMRSTSLSAFSQPA